MNIVQSSRYFEFETNSIMRNLFYVKDYRIFEKKETVYGFMNGYMKLCMDLFRLLLGVGPFIGWWWVVTDIFWLVVGGGG